MNALQKPNRNKFQEGFTIIELIVVVVIVGVMAALAGSNASDSTSIEKIAASKNRVVSLYRKARMSALNSAIPTVVFAKKSTVGGQVVVTFAAARAVDENEDGVIEWNDANGNAALDLGDLGGSPEIREVVDSVTVLERFVDVEVPSNVRAGYTAGCLEYPNGPACGGSNFESGYSLVFLSDGFSYTMDAIRPSGNGTRRFDHAKANLIFYSSDLISRKGLNNSTVDIVTIDTNGDIEDVY